MVAWPSVQHICCMYKSMDETLALQDGALPARLTRMPHDEPRNLRGLVQTKDLADFLGVTEDAVRAWRKRHLDWVARGRPASRAIPTAFPDPVGDPRSPGEAFLINAAAVYDMADVMRFAEYVEEHRRKLRDSG